MTEMQAAVGIAQLQKLNKILKLKKQNRKIVYDILKNSKSLEFRKSHDKSIKGDQNDHLIFYLKDATTAKKIKLKLNKNKINTGILPIALRWHYAGYWNHIWKEDKIYKKYLKINYWKNAWSLLQRSISIPISILPNKHILKKNAYKILKILDSH